MPVATIPPVCSKAGVVRDMDLVRAILLKVEAHDKPQEQRPIEIEGYTQEEVSYHLMIMKEAGLVDAVVRRGYRPFQWLVRDLTWEGHEFLDKARNENNWAKAKAKFAEAGQGVTLDVLKQVLTIIVQQAVL